MPQATERPRPLTKLQQQRRERILQAVRDQLEQGGYDALSMRDLAELAQVSPTTLYNLYESKDSLILTALTDLLGKINESVEGTNTRGLDRLLAHSQAMARQIVATPHYAEAMTRLMLNAGTDDPVARLLLHDAIDTFRIRLREMQEDRDMRKDVDIDLFAVRISTSNWGVILQWIKGYLPLTQLPREYTRHLILTLLPAMTPKAIRKYQGEVLVRSPVASAS